MERASPILAEGRTFRADAFEFACARADSDHRLTKSKHPCTNGKIERMNRTIKDATVKRYFYETQSELRKHLANSCQSDRSFKWIESQADHKIHAQIPS